MDHRINEAIQARTVQVIGTDGNYVGFLPLAHALILARQFAVDLVEIAHDATPPLCRLVPYSKYLNELEHTRRPPK